MPSLTPQQVEDAARAMPDHTLATSFLEPDARARVVALILFTHEISRARSVVSEAGLASIRLQWWRDTIDQIYSGQVVRAQPTVIALAGAVQEAKLPRALLDDMIDGYECELVAVPFPTWAALESYLDVTIGNLARLSLFAAGLPAMTTVIDDAVRHIATAWGLAHLIRTTPRWLERRCLWLPQEASAPLDTEALFAGHVSPALLAIFEGVKVRIKTARDQANRSIAQAKLGSCYPALAHACLALSYAKQAIPFAGPTWAVQPEASLLKRQIALTLSVARGRL